MKRIRSFLIVTVLVGLYGVAADISPDSLFGGRPVYAEAGHDDHDDEQDSTDQGRDEHEEGVARLNEYKLASMDLNVVAVRRGRLSQSFDLSGQVQWDVDRVAHVVPRVGGVVYQVKKKLGDAIQEGDVLAVLSSRELASTKAAYLMAHAKEQLAQANFDRERKLQEQQIGTKREYLEARNALEEVRIEKRLAELHLHAIGLGEDEIRRLVGASDSELTVYRMIAPFTGIVVEQHIARGEMLKNDSQAFKIVDPSSVWVMGQAYERDLRLLRKSQQTSIRLDAFPNERFEGKVDYIAGQLDTHTRTVEVRVVLANPAQRMRAGMFGVMTVFTDVDLKEDVSDAGLLVPNAALQRVKEGYVVFSKIGPDRFRMVPVQVRDKSKQYAQITGELKVDDLVVIGDTFVLKSEIAKEEMGGGHGH